MSKQRESVGRDEKCKRLEERVGKTKTREREIPKAIETNREIEREI